MLLQRSEFLFLRYHAQVVSFEVMIRNMADHDDMVRRARDFSRLIGSGPVVTASRLQTVNAGAAIKGNCAGVKPKGLAKISSPGGLSLMNRWVRGAFGERRSGWGVFWRKHNPSRAPTVCGIFYGNQSRR